MSDFLTFCRLHGVIIDALPPEGRWRRYPTEDKPRKKNAAVLWKGMQEGGFVKNWAVDEKAHHWKDENAAPPSAADLERQRAKRRAAQVTQEQGWARAADRAEEVLRTAASTNHGYLYRKGFEHGHGLVIPAGRWHERGTFEWPDATLFVPMRAFGSNRLQGAQLIHWDQTERAWQKRFTPGMRAQGAVFKLGQGREMVLCEGLATALSLEAAAAELRLSMQIAVCFSAHNITVIAGLLAAFPGGPRAMVFADNDPPRLGDPKNPGEAGQRAAIATGLPWTCSEVEGEDANDIHQQRGLRALCALLLDLRRR